MAGHYKVEVNHVDSEYHSALGGLQFINGEFLTLGKHITI